MQNNEKTRAIEFIRPNAQFTLRGDELDWLDESQTQPSNKEIEAGWVAYQEAQIVKEKAEAAKKAAAQSKLAALGLTVEDLQALGL